jgi:hypothetical protein
LCDRQRPRDKGANQQVVGLLVAEFVGLVCDEPTLLPVALLGQLADRSAAVPFFVIHGSTHVAPASSQTDGMPAARKEVIHGLQVVAP